MIKITGQTLLEQMRIDDIEIERRKEILNFSEEDSKNLALVKDVIVANVDDLVERFYEAQLGIDEIALLIGDADTLSRLKQAQRNYIIDLFNGFYDVDYVNNRLRIGMVHKRIGVEPKLYLTGVYTLKGLLKETLSNSFGQKSILIAVESALEKLFYFDTTLVFDTYIRSLVSEVSMSKSKAEQYARGLEEKVARRTEELERLSQRDDLTGLLNKRVLRQHLRTELRKIKKNESFLCFAYLDTDNFKDINDRLGHQKGDDILALLGQTINEACRERKSAFRYGGDEFCVVLPGLKLEAGKVFLEQLFIQLKQVCPELELSAGLVEAGADECPSPDQLIEAGDRLMYSAKNIDGNSIQTERFTHTPIQHIKDFASKKPRSLG